MRALRRIAGLALACLLIGLVPQAQPIPFDQFLLNLRLDLEILADQVFGERLRPPSWTANADLSSASIVADLWFDNEQLADEVFGAGQRPNDWIGATSTNAQIVARNVRHDLELSAERFLPEARPTDWVGAEPLTRCERSLQNLALTLQTRFGILPTVPTTLPDYCAAARSELEAQLTTLQLEPIANEELPALVLAVRGDLERLADEKLGLNNRPLGWIGNKDIDSPTLAADNFADLERLADELLGRAERPTGWIGSISGAGGVTYRNQRHDLELLTDATLGQDVRPRGWQNTDPIARCAPSLQSLLAILAADPSFETDFTLPATDSATYCRDLANDLNLLAENPPPPPDPDDVAAAEEAAEEARFSAESRFAFAYLDQAATLYMGQMPEGVRFRAWYRNFGESSMMFVSGDNFALFIDRRWTTMSEGAFVGLPTLEGVKPLTFCDADWCSGPRATPTPTAGALLSIIVGATPPATLVPGQNTDASGKRLVSWNHIRVTYIQQRPDVRRAQVTLEICQEVAQVVCEPVVSIKNNNTGVSEPVISVSNGLNVFEMPYGYSSNLLVEGTTLFSTDLWLNDPALSGQ